MTLLLGKPIADDVQTEICKKVASLSSPPGLAAILVGDNPSSHSYVNAKKRASENCGIRSFLHHLPEKTEEKELLSLIRSLNEDPAVDGILVQLPLPKHIHTAPIIAALDPEKDVDGFHPVNLGKLVSGEDLGFIPCTPLGIKVLLEKYKIPLNGKNVVIAGRSTTVGKPLALLLMQNAPDLNATVTVVHSQTVNLKEHTQHADILVAAIGKPHFITEDMVKKGAVVVDVGINRINDSKAQKGYRIVGDVDFEGVKKKASAITPVPKGVGPMTVAMLLHNTLLSYQRRLK